MVSVLNKTNECTDYATIITDQHYFTKNLRVKFILKIHHGGGGGFAGFDKVWQTILREATNTRNNIYTYVTYTGTCMQLILAFW